MKSFQEQEEDELVITAPADDLSHLAYQLNARSTLGVLVQLIARAKKEIILASPFLQSTKDQRDRTLVEAINTALKRGVTVNIVSTSTAINLFTLNDVFDVRGKIHYFQSKENIENNSNLGSHAKFCLADSKHVYIGSANFTWSGLHYNLEMGVLFHGKLAVKVAEFWEMAIQLGLIVEIENNKII